jgi:DNA-binding transcriptional LysR family regulator
LCASLGYVAKRGTPLHPQNLEHHNCMTFMRGGHRHMFWQFYKDGVKATVRVGGDRSVDDAFLARDWALVGYGILLKTRLELEPELTSGALVPLLLDWETETYPLNALQPSGRFVPNCVRALMEFLAPKLANHPWLKMSCYRAY